MRAILFILSLLPLITWAGDKDTNSWLPKRFVTACYNASVNSPLDSFAISGITLIESFKTIGEDIFIDNSYAERFGKPKLLAQKTKGLYKIDNISFFVTGQTYVENEKIANNCYVYISKESLKLILRFNAGVEDTIEYINSFMGYKFEGYTPTIIRLDFRGKYSLVNVKTKSADAITFNFDGSINGNSMWTKYNSMEIRYYYLNGKIVYTYTSDFQLDLYDWKGIKHSFIAVLSLKNKRDYRLYEYDYKTMNLKKCAYVLHRTWTIPYVLD